MNDLLELLGQIFILAGALFVFVAGLGVLRMPDLFLRMSASTKAATLGVGLMFAGVAFHFADAGTAVRVLGIVAFIFLTAPISAHMLGRAAYFIGVKLWEGTHTDHLKDHYDPQTHTLSSHPIAAEGEPGGEVAVEPGD